MDRQEFEQRIDQLLREYILNSDNEDINICNKVSWAGMSREWLVDISVRKII